MLYAGLDLHKRFSVVTAVDVQGNRIRQEKMANDQVVRFFEDLGEPVEVALEAGRNWYWLYDLLEESGIRVKLSHPLKTKAIASARVKNDKVDSATLAHLLRANLLPLCYVPEREVRLKRELLRYGASLVRVQTGLKNCIHSLLAKNNINHDFSDLFGREGKVFLRSLTLPQVYRMAVEGYLGVLATLEEEIAARASREIKASAQEDGEARLLMTIPGVGYYSGLLIRSEIGEVGRFPSAKQLCSYAGLVPSTHASGNSVYYGHITKQGSRHLRWILLEVVIHAIQRPGPLQEFYRRMERKKGQKVARVATARKLLEWIYQMLKEDKTFEEVERVAAGRGEPAFTHGR